MDFIFIDKDGKTYASLKGVVGTMQCESLEAEIAPLMDPSRNYVELNCSGLEYISSSGLRLLFTLQKNISAHKGKFVITQPSDYLANLLHITGFDRFITIEK